ncbi:MAG: carboxypeptidase-like regulatory domain-containing protein [Acidobacteriia bacterium]|nr:carboxypeptidase-like regulatory domain-containing protein [Terriglobia bacterium]
MICLPSAEAAGSLITGTVIGADGQAASGTTVRIEPVGAKKHYWVKTAKGGNFSYSNLPLGKYLIWAEDKSGSTAPIEVDTRVNANATVTLRLPNTPGSSRRSQISPLPSQEAIVEGCISVRDIHNVSGGSYLLQGTVLQSNIPRLQATVLNECTQVATIFFTLGYYDPSGTQFDTQIETATVAPGTRYSLVHLLYCAKDRTAGSCTPEQWKTQIRLIQVRARN